MVERARRLASVEGSASVVMEHPDSFFQAAESEYPDAPVWSGELYLELHRGTFTSQARTKIGNRRTEHLLREAELWSTQAAVAAGQDYPYDELERVWKIALVHQFHDILPGSAIAWVRREAEAAYSQLRIDIEKLIDKAVTAVANASGTDSDAAPHPWIFNASPWDRTAVAVFPPGRLEGQLARTSSGVQRLSDGSTAVHARMPGHSASRLEPRKPASPVTVEGSVMDNGLVRVELDERGLLVSLRDLAAGREVIAPGSGGNLLQLHPDYPSQWDAWDIDRSYRTQVKDLLIADVVDVVDRGPLVGSIRVVRTVGDTRVIQTITVRAGSRRVDIATEADWQERQRILKAAFPLDVHADRTAAEIQFGHVMRPLHVNTSWEAARFESYAHRFIHVAEPGYGVGLLTDATYGFDAGRHTRPDGGTTTTVRLSLLRSARFPDPDADIGRHRFRYSLLPGAALDETIAEGYALNIPPRLAAGPGTGPARTWLHTSEPAVVVDTVKLAEDRSGDVIVRLYESLGGRARAELRVPFGLASVEAVDLLERPLPNTQRLEHSTVAGNRSAGLTLPCGPSRC
jgi:alpha-mannosidase